jgi:acyl-coenzyme A synthetase/AMP-(fatty) acid ligase
VHWAERTPAAPALIEHRRTVSYGELLRGARAGAAWLHEHGVRAGATVALSLEPAPALTVRQVCLIYALACLGAALLPLYPGVPAALRGPLAARFNARWLIAAHALPELADCVRLNPAAFQPESDALRAAAPPCVDEPERPLRYEFTSGTTGAPKVVLFTAAQYAGNARTAARCFGWTPQDRVLPVVRWPGKSCLRSLARTHAAGAALLDLPYPESREGLAQAIEQYGLTALQSVPWQLRHLLASPSPGRRPPPLRFLETAGAFIAPHEIRAVREGLTSNLHVIYASSEVGLLAHLPPAEPHDAPLPLVPGVEAQAVGDDGQPLAPGAIGRLRFRAPWFPSHYVGNEADSAAQFAAGWFHPGDRGALDAAGRLTLHGRADDTINSGGTKIVPRDVEAVLGQHPDVMEAALVGIPDPLKGELPVAFVVPRRGASPARLREFCAARLDASWLPTAVLEIPAMPRTPDGKIRRERLREIFRERVARGA